MRGGALKVLGPEYQLCLAVFLFPADGLGVHQPLRFAGAARILLLDTREPSDTEKAADLGAGGIQLGSRLLSGEPAVAIRGHRGRASRAAESRA